MFGSLDEFAGKGLAFFEFQPRSWFEDPIPDLTERRLVQTRL